MVDRIPLFSTMATEVWGDSMKLGAGTRDRLLSDHTSGRVLMGRKTRIIGVGLFNAPAAESKRRNYRQATARKCEEASSST